MLFGIESILINCILSFIFSLVFTIFGLKYLIKYLQNHKAFQPIRMDGPMSHRIMKSKTPTMGGAISCLAIIFSTFLFCNLKDEYILISLLICITFSLLGFIDDFLKVFYKSDFGFRGSIKLTLQLIISSLIILFLFYIGDPIIREETIFIPFFHTNLYLGILLIPFLVFVITGSANAVNITDGLDGLAIIPIIFCASALGVIAYFNTPYYINNLFPIINHNDLSSLSILCSSIVGTGIGFFIYNVYPAKIFMGDVGSLMYGGLLAIISIILGYEIFYGLIGLIFVVEILSTTIQVTGHFFFGKKIFRMAPLHHHFEKCGWSERKVIFIFWLFALICLIVGFLGIINFSMC